MLGGWRVKVWKNGGTVVTTHPYKTGDLAPNAPPMDKKIAERKLEQRKDATANHVLATVRLYSLYPPGETNFLDPKNKNVPRFVYVREDVRIFGQQIRGVGAND
jgi:hypothetical protein